MVTGRDWSTDLASAARNAAEYDTGDYDRPGPSDWQEYVEHVPPPPPHICDTCGARDAAHRGGICCPGCVCGAHEYYAQHPKRETGAA